jgi:hypothetical protein
MWGRPGAGRRWGLSRLRPLAAIASVALIVCVVVTAATVARAVEPNAAQTAVQGTTVAALGVDVDQVLTLVNERVTINIEGDAGRSLIGTKLVVRVKGPATASQVGEAAPQLAEADKIVAVLGAPSAAVTATTATTGETEAGAAPIVTSTTTTTLGLSANGDAELAAGKLSVSVPLGAQRPGQPGAYLLVVEIKSGPTVIASGQAWIGKVAVREKPLDLAFVWPVSLGVHRDAGGVFYDSVIEDSLAVAGPGSGSLRGAASMAELFPGWNFTLAIEPVLLTQLRDMADGYTRLDALGNEVEVEANDPRAQNADALLAAFKTAADSGSVELVVSPYAGADLNMLALENWRDGFEQIQMGKQELQQTLGLGGPLTGAFSPDLDLTSGSLASYAEASIDHIVVDSSLAGMLTEPIDPYVVTVRARDEENHRATLVFADTVLGSRLVSPWDPSLLFATLAAELAENPRDALVITPRIEFTLVPDSYLESVGEVLDDLDWVKTQTLSGLLRDYSPGTRPVMLKTGAGAATGYIESVLLDDLRSAHAVVTDLAEIADATRAPVEAVHRLLYIAESRWWWRPGASPQEASMGLEYARRARELAQAELGKVKFNGAESSLITGSEGVVSLSVENKADYSVAAHVQLGGTGLNLPDGQTIDVELLPGRTVVPVRVAIAEGAHVLEVRLVAGQSTLDQISRSVRFITIKTVLPAIVVGGLAVLVGLYFLCRRLLRKPLTKWRRGRAR